MTMTTLPYANALEFIACNSPNVQAAYEKWTRVGDQLAKSWKQNTPPRACDGFDPNTIDRWKAGLDGAKTINYVYAFSSPLYTMLCNCHPDRFDNPEGYLIATANDPVRVEIKIYQDSRFTKSHAKYHVIDGFITLGEPYFSFELMTECEGDKLAMIAVPHIAESLRTRELSDLFFLHLEHISPSIIRVTLDQDMNGGFEMGD